MKPCGRKWFADILLVMACFCAVCIAGGCGSTFTISKGDRSYYMGSSSAEMRRMLCDTGDLKKIIEDANLPQDKEENLYYYTCSEPSRENVREVFASLSKEERKELRLSFKKRGYEINRAYC